MSTFITSIGTVLTGILSWLGTITTALLTNEFIQIAVTFVVVAMLVKLLVGFIKRRR